MLKLTKKILLLLSCMTTMTLTAAHTPSTKAEENSEVNNILISELFGYSIGTSLKSQEAPFDRDAVIRGIINGSEGAPPPVADQDCEKVLEKVQEKDIKAMKEKIMKNWKKISKTTK